MEAEEGAQRLKGLQKKLQREKIRATGAEAQIDSERFTRR
jgi:hypothetical protein